MSGNQYENDSATSVTPTTTYAPWYMKPAWRRAVILCVALVVAIGVGEFVMASDERTAEEPQNERHVATNAEGFSNWSKKAYTEKYNPTVYALSGMAGWQLQDLMLCLKYEWDDSTCEWAVDDYRVFVSDADGVNLDMARVGALSKNSSENTVVYTIETPEFGSVEDAYERLVSEVMDNEDSERIGDDVLVGIAQNVWDELVLITAGKMEEPGMMRVRVFTEPAIQAGCFDRCFDAASETPGGTFGAGVEEVFRTLAGRSPAFTKD